MKKTTLLTLLIACISLWAQAQTGFKWQGLAKDAAGNPVTQPVALTFSILQNNTSVYTETHAPITPVKGQLTATVGMGTPTQGSFSGIDWSVASSLNVKMQVGSGNQLDMGASEILSSPLLGGQWLKSGNNVYRLDGNVGIGTNVPETELDVEGEITATNFISLRPASTANDDSTRLIIGGAYNQGIQHDYFRIHHNMGLNASTTRKNLWIYGSSARCMDVSIDGRLSVGNLKNGGNANDFSVEIKGEGNSRLIGLKAANASTDLWISSYDEIGNRLWVLNMGDRSHDDRFGLYSHEIDTYVFNVSKQGNVGILKNSTANYALDVNGTSRTRILEITGGSDFAENFDITSVQPEPGMVVCIDPENPGNLTIATQAYDRKVAGIISGAGGISPGMIMGQEESIANGKYPVAMVGRVYVQADASYGKIEPGDMLTTSPTAGVAMKVSDHSLAHGATIGKAMTSLQEGRGLVMVLVNLQ